MPVILLLLTGVLPFLPMAQRQAVHAAAENGTPEMATPGLPAGTDVATATATPNPVPVPETTPPHHYVVMIVVDASRASYVELSRLPHIQALMRHGVVYDRAWVGQMESSTPGVHVTLGTGTLPRENGFLGFGWAVPETRKWIDFRTLLADRAIDPVLRSLPAPSVAARMRQFMPNAISVAASGHKDYATVGLGGGVADYELYGKYLQKTFVPAFMHAPPPLSAAEKASLRIPRPLPPGAEDAWAMRYAELVAGRVKPRLLMINLPEMDTWGHWKGTSDQALFHRLMQNVDRGIGVIEATYRRLGILQQTDFIVTADHAMMESRPARNWGLVGQAALAVGAKVARADGTGGGIWLQDPAGAKAVAERLAAMRPAHVMAIFYRSNAGNDYSYVRASPEAWLVNKRAATALQHLVDTTAGQNGPDMWVLYRENYTVLATNVSGMWKGTHGGATWKVQHVPLIMSGPGIKRGIHSRFPARSVDIAPTIERLLGLPPMHRDGVILSDALAAPAPYELKPQRTIAPVLDADVTALMAQSRWDNSYDRSWPKVPPSINRCSVKQASGTPDVTCSMPANAPTDG